MTQFVLGANSLANPAEAPISTSSISIGNSTKSYSYLNFDITQAVKFFASKVKVLKRSVTVYHWERNTYYIPSSLAKYFWRAYGQTSSSMYGAGLYAAVDPVLTYSYGGGDTSAWTLMEMILPVGFKLFELNVSDQSKKFDGLEAIEAQFSCPSLRDVDALFDSGGSKVSESCRGLIKNILQDILKIDGIAYSYSYTHFDVCQNSSGMSNKAFIITNDSWMTSENVITFTKDSKHNMDDRILIQTLMLKSSEQGTTTLSETSISKIAQFVQTHESMSLKNSISACADGYCEISLRFCDPANNCENIVLDKLIRPGGPLITAVEAQKSGSSSLGSLPKVLLWQDLEGQPKSSTLTSWLNNNMFGCDGKVPFSEENSQLNQNQ